MATNDGLARSPALRLTVHNQSGTGTQIVNSDHYLAGPWRLAIETGRPTGQWRGLAFRDGDGLPRMFGYLTHTEGGRMLWFPAANVTLPANQTDIDGVQQNHGGGVVDHVTLDVQTKGGRYRSHITFRHGAHEANVTVFPPEGHQVPWFSMLMPRLDDLVPLPETLHIDFEAVRTDTAYPAALAGEGAWTISDGLAAPDAASFIQFDVWAGMEDHWAELEFRGIPWVLKPGIADDAPDPQTSDARVAVIRISERRGLTVVMTTPQGRLRAPRLLRMSTWTPDVP